MCNDGHSSAATPPSTDALQPVGCADTRAEAKAGSVCFPTLTYYFSTSRHEQQIDLRPCQPQDM